MQEVREAGMAVVPPTVNATLIGQFKRKTSERCYKDIKGV